MPLLQEKIRKKKRIKDQQTLSVNTNQFSVHNSLYYSLYYNIII